MISIIKATHERVDDIPAIVAHLIKMRLAQLLDKHFPTNGNWTGLSLGWVTLIWITYLLSEGDHRLYHVEDWVREHHRTLSKLIGKPVRPRDFNDDRLARVLDYLCVSENWVAFERELNQTTLRVYDLTGRWTRIDTTTASAFVTPEGMFQLGHSKDHRPDLPQLKIAMSTLDPLGLPLTITTVAGNTADDPLYLPEISKIRQIAQVAGLTYVGDCKMAALGTRAEIVAYKDFYLCPLSAKQMPEAELDRLLEPVFNRKLKPVEIRLPNADGQIDETEDPVAIGFEYTVEQSTQDKNGKSQTWQERRLVVRSLAFAESQEKNLRQRAASAVKQINQLDERKKGKKPLPDETAARQAAETIIAKYRVAGLIKVSVRTEIQEQEKRRYGSRPAGIVRSERVGVSAEIDKAAIKQAVQRLGWRVYATNHAAEDLSLAQAVAAYRSEYLIEQGFGRLKGRCLSLTPLYLHFEHRIVGLISLLSIALRVVVLIQFVVRRNLQKEGTTLKGIYPGQPGRQTKSPTTEMMLRAFRGLTLSRIRVNGQAQDHLTPLNDTQKRILKLMEVPLEAYSCLVT